MWKLDRLNCSEEDKGEEGEVCVRIHYKASLTNITGRAEKRNSSCSTLQKRERRHNHEQGKNVEHV